MQQEFDPSNNLLTEAFCTAFFNDFLLEHVQPYLLKTNKTRQIRSTLQYLIQILDILTCPQLIETVYRFLFGFPEDLLIEAGLVKADSINGTTLNLSALETTNSSDSSQDKMGSKSARGVVTQSFAIEISKINYHSKLQKSS